MRPYSESLQEIESRIENPTPEDARRLLAAIRYLEDLPRYYESVEPVVISLMYIFEGKTPIKVKWKEYFPERWARMTPEERKENGVE